MKAPSREVGKFAPTNESAYVRNNVSNKYGYKERNKNYEKQAT